MWAAKRDWPAALALALLLTGCGRMQSAGSENIYTPPAETGVKTANYHTMELAPADVTKVSSLNVDPVYDVSVAVKTQEPLIFGEYLVSRGDRVQAGDPLARFSRNASQADAEEARLALQRAQETYDADVARLEAACAASQGTAQALARLDLEEYQLQGDQRLAELTRALEDARARLEDVYYYAPFDAVVREQTSYSPGAKLPAGSGLVTLCKTDSLVLTATSNTDFFQYNMPVTVEYGKVNSRKTVTGRVVATDRVLTDQPAMAAVYIALDDRTLTAEELEKPTAYVTTVQLKQAMVVPKSAVETENGESYVNILQGDTVQPRYITKGITGGSVGEFQVQVLAGLEYGQLIVLD